jgi:putative ABC transport system permease protein
MRALWRRLLASTRGAAADRDLDAEVDFHLQMQAREFQARGMSAEEARLAARRAFGGVDQVKETYRDRRGLPILDALQQDVRHAVRGLRRTPGFTAAAVLTLGLGIGATSAIFSVTHAVLLAPLPYADLDRRVMVWSQWKGFEKTWVSEAELIDYRTRCRTIRQAAAWDSGQINITGAGEPVRVGIGRVTANAFETLGARPLLGRTFSAAEDVPGRNAVVVLSHRLWQGLYAGDPDILGRVVHLDGRPHAVVGVMPAGFQLPTDYGEDASQPTELWVPLAIDPAEVERNSHGLYAAAELAPGATAASASAEVRALGVTLTGEGLYPADMQFRPFAVGLEDEILGKVRPAVMLLLGAVGFLLLIACANVASLMLARSESRHRDVAVRAALGAGRARLIRHVLTESLLLGLGGAVLGLIVAAGVARVLTAVGPAAIPRVDSVAVDSTVLLFTALLGLVTTGLFGLLPAWRTARVPPIESLREAGARTTASPARRRLRGLLVVAETALAVVLIVGAGLMLRSLHALRQVDLGFQQAGVLTARLWLPAASYPDPGSTVAFCSRFLERVRALPGVSAAGMVRSLPLAATIGDWGLDIEGLSADANRRPKGDWQVATDGAFEALGERLRRGRFFDARDATDSQQVAVVNETMARTYWPGRDPIGQRIRLGRGAVNRPWVTVVGVVADERHNGITAAVKEKFYRPHSQFHRSTGNAVRGMTLVVRGPGDVTRLTGSVRAVLREMDPSLPLAGVRTMDEVVNAAMVTPRATGGVLVLFAVLAIALAAIGIYGVLTYLVSERRREIGVRVAMGATAGQVIRLVLGHGLGLAVVGLALGLVLAAALTRVMAGQLHDVTPLDPLTFAVVPLVLLGVAAASGYLPARRATRVDPVVALRSE